MSGARLVAILAIGILVAAALPLTPTRGASIVAQPALAKKKCHYVTKKVKGHKKKVKVCIKVKPTATPTSTPTATPTDTATPTPTPSPTLMPTSPTFPLPPLSAADLAHDVSANLFEWNWPSVGRECTNVLGPDGFGSVQVAPPQDSLDIIGHPWYDVYQPADYNLTSRFGNEEQFKAMVATCRSAGVRVLVDAVINHMSASGGTSYGGYHYSKYNYPGLWSFNDFHHYPADCPEPDGTIHDFNNYTEVTKCELLGLADLRTEAANVRATLAGYLNKLIGYGVSGFRVDSAKHIGQTDLSAIESMLHNTVDGQPPYMALEVALGSDGQLAPSAFEGQGSLLGFDFAGALQAAFDNNIATLKNIDSGLLHSDKELAFVQNHDTERNGSTLNYKDGAIDILATEFMLAWGYGTPQVYASFNWSGYNDPPPSDANGYVTDTTCGAGWTCTDRDPGVADMVGWHNLVGSAPVTNWYDDGTNLIAFSRGALGWIAINNETTPQTHVFSTGLPAGSYCNLILGNSASCNGPSITVDSQGQATITVGAKSAVAIDVASVANGG